MEEVEQGEGVEELGQEALSLICRKALGMVYEPKDSGSGGLQAYTDGIFTARLHSFPSSATSRPRLCSVVTSRLSFPRVVAGRCASMGCHWPRARPNAGHTGR